MYSDCVPSMTTRREFLARAGGAGVGLSAMAAGVAPAATAPPAPDSALDRLPAFDQEPASELLPTVALGGHRVTRLVAGYNPIGGHSHTTLNMARHMREFFTAERTARFLGHCERQGINTWQYDHTDKTLEAIRLARKAGCSIQLICLHAERPHDAPLDEVMRNQPIAIVHHGGVTDSLFRAGRASRVHDFVKKVHDVGALAGVSSHCPDNIKRMADEGWENDLFMTCFHYLTRTRDAMLQEFGKVTVGEPFFDSDRDDMTAVIRQVDRPCLAFKILAAGRRCWSKRSIDAAFKYAFEHIKPGDAVIVGMFPRYQDEVAEGVALTRKYSG